MADTTQFVGELRLAQVLQSIHEKLMAETEKSFHHLTVPTEAALNALTTDEGGQDGNTLYFVGTAAPYQMFVWSDSAYIAIGSGGGTVNTELSGTDVDTILDANGFPKQLS
jgi:hypothetical protein